MGDERVRDSHAEMEGQKVPIDEPFILPGGAKAMYPGESGVAAEDINCRCFVEYVEEKTPTEKTKENGGTLENTEQIRYNINKRIGKIESENRVKFGLNLQLFGNKDVPKQTNNQLKKGIKSYYKQIEKHLDKMRHPRKYYKEWNNFTKEYKRGCYEHWRTELRNFKKNINDNNNELKRRENNDKE